MRRTWKSFLSLLLAFAMILSLGVSGFALEDETDVTPEEAPAEETGSGAGLEFEQVDNDIISERLPHAAEAVEEEEAPYADNDLVRVSIVLEGRSAIDAGYAPQRAGVYRATLRAQQRAMANKISAEALGGQRLDVVWNLTLAGNIISANVEYGKLDAIRNTIGVRDVILETRYEPNEGETVDPENITATGLTGATAAWNLGYTGAGSTIAIVDTGLDTDHQSFDPAAFQYAIDELNEGRETPIKLMTAADVAAKWDQLNAASFIGSVDGVYLNAKVPFAVNYVDGDLNVTHDYDTAGEHGSHVAGIAAANKYIPGADGYENALEAVMTQGEAPDAQLLIMKVFGANGGAYESDYMAAVEDAITLGCDAVNLSLGSSAPGFTTNEYYESLFNKLAASGLVWTNSAGNNSSWVKNSVGTLYADDIAYHTGGSPATYANTLSVASVDNTTQMCKPIILSDGSRILYYESLTDANGNPYGNTALATLAQDEPLGFILIPGPGVYTDDDDNITQNDFETLGPDVLEGKVAICLRGSSYFYMKANAAAENGAIATIIGNNQAGVIYLNLSGYEYTAPAVTVTKNDLINILMQAEAKQKDGVTYYEGSFTVTDEDMLLDPSVVGMPTSQVQTMSDFSSMGGNGALTMKPEITAPGGNIWSVDGSVPGGQAYEVMSGTSMAAPQVAGLVAVLRQYMREEGVMDRLSDTGLTERAVAQSLLMSTAMPLYDSYGYYWSILKQGAGLADVNAAITARSLIQVTDLPASAPDSAWDSIADGKVKMEIGEVGSSFTASFNVTNFSEEDMSVYLDGSFFTQYLDGNYRYDDTDYVNAAISWNVDGEAYSAMPLAFDFNGDGVTNGGDAQLLLEYCADDSVQLLNEQYADLDGDGNIDTYDAKLAFEYFNGAGVEIPAGETVHVSVTVSLNMDAYKDYKGNFVEGFLYVREGDSGDGALGVVHSIPVYGYYGSISEPEMFDRGSYLEYEHGFGDGAEDNFLGSYLFYGVYKTTQQVNYDLLDTQAFLIQYAGEEDKYVFGGNPLILDEEYLPERNAMNSKNMLAGYRFSLIRNAGASRFYVTDKYGRTVPGTEMDTGAITAMYYYPSNGTWQNTVGQLRFRFMPADVEEGDEFTAHFQVAPEYYVHDGEVNWDELGAGTENSIPFVIDNTAPDIVKVTHDVMAAPVTGENEMPVSRPTFAADQPMDEDDNPIEPTEPTEPEEPEEPEVSNLLNVVVHDNQYVAAVALFTDDGYLLSAQGAVMDTIRGKELVYTFNLDEIFADPDFQELYGENGYDYLLVQVYDYAENLSTYKINFKAEEEGAQVTSVSLSDEEILIWNHNSYQLTPDVRPWGLDDNCVWTSSDETVATVDKHGVVTGVAPGECVITAASQLDLEKTATCSVTVKFVAKDLNSTLWDENGEVWVVGFNSSQPAVYEKQNALDRARLTAMTYGGDGKLYGVDFDTDAWTSNVYTLDEQMNPTLLGPAGVGLMDLTGSAVFPQYLIGVYAYYVIIIDAESGELVGTINNKTATGGKYFVGITYRNTVDYSAYDYGYCDNYFLVDQTGQLYSMIISSEQGFFYASKMKDTAFPYSTDTVYWSSLYWDGDTLFWSRFNNEVADLLVWNTPMVSGEFVRLGRYPDGVWPVAGLFQKGLIPANGYAPIEDDPLEPDAIPAGLVPAELEFEVEDLCPNRPEPEAEEPVIEEPVLPGEPVTPGELGDPEDPIVPGEPVADPDPVTEPVGGGLNSIRTDTGADASVEKLNAEFLVVITADMFTTNGKIVVDFDPTTITLLDANTPAQFSATLDRSEDLGHFVLAWVDLDGIDTDETILTLRFSMDSQGVINVTTVEENENDPEVELANLPREEQIVLGASVVPAHEHEYAFDHFNWSEDLESAVAVFTCGVCGVGKCYEAEVTKVTTDPDCDKPGLITITATVVVDGETYTDVKTEELDPIGHDWGEPSYDWVGSDMSGYMVTAKVVCKNNPDHTITETVMPYYDGDALALSCTEDGHGTYIATFEDEHFSTQTKEIVLPAAGHSWGEPEWTWNEDFTAATAAFVCGACEADTTADATVASELADGVVTLTATATLDGETYTDVKTLTVGARTDGKTLTIGTKFTDRAYLVLSDELAADTGAYVILTVNGKTTKILVSKAKKEIYNGTTSYGFDYNIGLTHLNDEVTMRLYAGDGTLLAIVDRDTGEYLPGGYTYTGQQYIDGKLAKDSTKETLKAVLRALNDVGRYAQLYFNWNTDKLAEAVCDLSTVDLTALSDYAAVVNVENDEVLTPNGTSVLLQDEIKIRKYFVLADGVNKTDLHFYINGKEVSAKNGKGEVYIETGNVPAKDLDVAYLFEVKDAEGTLVFSATYSIYSYAFSKAETDNENLANLLKALVLYCDAAKVYFK